MPVKRWSDEDVINAYRQAGDDPTKAAAMLGAASATIVHMRLAAIESRTGIKIRTGKHSKVWVSRDTRPNVIELENGTILVGSDAHYWPGETSTAHRAFVRLCKKLKPWAVVMNGDEFDGASISRHGRIGWEQRPPVSAEIKALQSSMAEIAKAAKGAHLLGSFGNHTIRWDTYLSANASQAEGVPGMKFEDLLGEWSYAWAWMVNGHTLIKHRAKGGIHATWNNTGDAQVSTVTGHLHNLRITPRSTMSPVNGGTIYGVDTGMLADPWGPQFGYLEQGQRNWRSGFAVLTFRDGILMPPELVQVVDEGRAWFRGELLEV